MEHFKFTIATMLALAVVFVGLLVLMKPDRILEVPDQSGLATVAVYGEIIHVDLGPAGYKQVYIDQNTGRLKTLLVTGFPRRGIMLISRRDADDRETRIWHAVYWQ